MMLAAQEGHADALRALAALGADAWTTSAMHAARDEAEHRGYPGCARWLQRAIGWRPIHRLCDSRRGAEHLIAALRGGADPALASPHGETPLALCTLADPKEGALPEDAAMTAVMQRALLPWRLDRHDVFPRAFVPRVIALLLLHGRLERQAAAHARLQQSRRRPATRAHRRRGALLAVRLTRELWLAVVPFLPRFGVAGRRPA